MALALEKSSGSNSFVARLGGFAGLYLSALGMLHHSRREAAMSGLLAKHFLMRYLAESV